MSFSRKCRPQTISELDSEQMSTRLAKTFSGGNFPHALLFAGPKGTGKTSAARIIAKLINCTHKKKSAIKGISYFEPCNTCDSCLSIIRGNHMDVLEIDAASNRGIDEIRDLREKIRLSPGQSAFKVYIIDEVHMLTTEAFNALLKTLEEPPPHAIFILATTDPDKLPGTIISRTMLFSFSKAGKRDIMHSLKRVVNSEGITISEEILLQISELADGSFRDATKILEQALSEGATTLSQFEKIFGKSSSSAVSVVSLLAKKDTKSLLTILEDLDSSGGDARKFVSDLLNLLHSILLAYYEIKTEEDIIKMKNILTVPDIISLIKLFSTVYPMVKNSSSPVLPVMVAVVEWCEKKSEKLKV